MPSTVENVSRVVVPVHVALVLKFYLMTRQLPELDKPLPLLDYVVTDTWAVLGVAAAVGIALTQVWGRRLGLVFYEV